MEISLLDGWLLKFICCSLHGAIWAINVEHVPTQIGGRCRSWPCRQCMCLKVRLVKSRKDGKAPSYILGDMGRLIFSFLFNILQFPVLTRLCLWVSPTALHHRCSPGGSHGFHDCIHSGMWGAARNTTGADIGIKIWVSKSTPRVVTAATGHSGPLLPHL